MKPRSLGLDRLPDVAVKTTCGHVQEDADALPGVDHGSRGGVLRIYQRRNAVNDNLGSEIAEPQAKVHPGVFACLQLDSFADNRFEADCADR